MQTSPYWWAEALDETCWALDWWAEALDETCWALDTLIGMALDYLAANPAVAAITLREVRPSEADDMDLYGLDSEVLDFLDAWVCEYPELHTENGGPQFSNSRVTPETKSALLALLEQVLREGLDFSEAAYQDTGRTVVVTRDHLRMPAELVYKDIRKEIENAD